jgi:hypothetical protein
VTGLLALGLSLTGLVARFGAEGGDLLLQLLPLLVLLALLRLNLFGGLERGEFELLALGLELSQEGLVLGRQLSLGGGSLLGRLLSRLSRTSLGTQLRLEIGLQ